MEKLIILGLLLLGACASPGDYEWDVCERATDGLPRDDFKQCLQDIYEARYDAWHDAAQVYRNKSRPRAGK